LHPLDEQIAAIEMISGRKVIAITVNHEGMQPEEISPACAAITAATGLPAFDVLAHGPAGLSNLVKSYLK
jgi:uncharacterized NAD-dependent epimerase/dehydratase family protein